MHGSATLTDILNDVNTTLVTPSLSGVNFPSGVQIMTGIYTPWKSVHDTVISAAKSLIAKYPDYTLESTSHSLGGSLTYILYIALAQNFPTKSITSNALAAFPVGNAAFAAFGMAQTDLLRRGNNALNCVPVSLAYSGLAPPQLPSNAQASAISPALLGMACQLTVSPPPTVPLTRLAMIGGTVRRMQARPAPAEPRTSHMKNDCFSHQCSMTKLIPNITSDIWRRLDGGN